MMLLYLWTNIAHLESVWRIIKAFVVLNAEK